MDDVTVQWSQRRYKEIVDSLTPFLKSRGFSKKNFEFIPVSGLIGDNIKEAVSKDKCPWIHPTKSLIQALDQLEPIKRNADAPLRLPVQNRYRYKGSIYCIGKVEQGKLCTGMKLSIMPTDKQLEVLSILVDDHDVKVAMPGENIELQVKGVSYEDIQSGYVLGPMDDKCSRTTAFFAQLVVFPLLPHKPLISAGYTCILHIHNLSVKCSIDALVAELNKKTGRRLKKRPPFVRAGSVITAKLSVDQSIAIEMFAISPKLGRFTLRDEGKTIAIGKVIKMA